MRTALVADGDLTARARILASAFDRFAARGYEGASLREIASNAGVSTALVTHHFGTKLALREECDARVARFIADKRDGATGAADVLGEVLGTYGPYLARMLGDGGEASAALFARLLEVARAMIDDGSASGWLRPSRDPEAQAATLVMLGVAPFLMIGPLTSWAGGADRALGRIAVPLAELYTHGLTTDDRLLAAVGLASEEAR
ncbi:TetR family transcriptional regulator [Agromyces aurantiacus]|uniref:TetR family transcriptional regulator n=1 Tax=Agromyces aurantiacus TaxID=165814 RepID=A0ABV9RAB7_9MICO|nr:TetR family transcriptional regulator [Agromyces aurantiacus]MBM7503776.1 AcrR family transcriptional regulator [Agromyces aurantiacus]